MQKATVGTSAQGCNAKKACCLPGGSHIGGCRVWVPSKDPRLFETKKRCDGRVKCDVVMINYVDCKDPDNNGTVKRTSLDFQLLFYSCIKSGGSVASACIEQNPGLRLSLRCSRSTLIQIVRVVVGMRDNRTCPEGQCCPDRPADLFEMDGLRDNCLSDIIFWCDGLRECYYTGPVGERCAPFEQIDFQYAFYQCIPALPVSSITAGLILLLLSIIVPVVYYMTPEKVILKSTIFPNQEEPGYVPPDVGFTHEESDGFEYDETPVTWNSLAYTDVESFDGSAIQEPKRKVESTRFPFEKHMYEYHDDPSSTEEHERQEKEMERTRFMASWSSLAHTEIENLENGDGDLESIDYDTGSQHSEPDHLSSNESMAQLS
ncbi:hypothetical protein CAPTEDRAFT_224817 [Capitella teleta]|uniref:Uncharacterized protein n=1 Tax=Capitella teleta TaxID=283909 RepID=R7ULU1_CAPTE|nr:hypothetical protein CAPTEDRAFT_224817 [Capitella teleta]|eukprot:ELU07499.1 hypothetical protein CAPTEDRAFT_224817 [Capitella teleta]